MVVMFSAKIDVIVLSVSSLFHVLRKLFVIHTFGVLNYHLQKMCLYLGAGSFVIWFWIFLCTYVL